MFMRGKISPTLTPSDGQRGCSPLGAWLFSTVFWGLVTPVFAATPVGLWYAEGGAAQVEISACGDGLCGWIVWLRSPLDETGCELRDRSNGDASLRDRPLLGLEILQGLKPADGEGTVWTDGTIYDPASGKTYTCNLRVEGDNRLHLRGYIGLPLLGRTTTWVRVGSENRQCQP
jgi:uncharacterized protein (DUF2147 family)